MRFELCPRDTDCLSVHATLSTCNQKGFPLRVIRVILLLSIEVQVGNI